MKNSIRIIIAVLLLIVFAYSGYRIFDYYSGEKKQTDAFDQIVSIVERAREEEPEPEAKGMLPEYAELYALNNDLAGWIRIPGTLVNYPVMQTPDNPTFYLNHSFEKEYSTFGVPFIGEGCDLEKPSDNVIIYGHHMKSGKVFGSLDGYKDEDFFKEHQFILFDTLTERSEYQVVTIFKTNVGAKNDFEYHKFIDAANPKEFDEFVAKCKELSYYETGISAKYGDELITLSTCEYSTANGRLVVIAKKIVDR